MAQEFTEDELRDFLRRHGYYVPETEEEAQTLRAALSFVMDAITAKREIRSKARIAVVWGVVFTIAVAATKETLKPIWRAISKLFGGG